MAAHHVSSRGGQTGAFFLKVLFCVAVPIVFALLGAAVCYLTDNPTSHLPVASLVAFLCAGAISAFFLARRDGETPAPICMLPLLAFAAILLLTALVISGGKLPLRVPTNLLCYLLVGFLFAFLGKLKKKKSGKRRFSR